MFPRHVSEHFPIIGTLEAAKSHPAYQTAQTDIPGGRIVRQRGQQDQPADKNHQPEGRDERRGDRIRPATRVRRDQHDANRPWGEQQRGRYRAVAIYALKQERQRDKRDPLAHKRGQRGQRGEGEAPVSEHHRRQ